MATFFLILIYITFISLGLPDSLLGSAWPALHLDIASPLAGAGVISCIVTGGTIISSLMTDRLVRWLGTGKLTAISVLMTACALVGFSLAPGFWWLCLLAAPLGLGAGAVDAGLNNYVALHYAARHMSWLHCFWGIGATAGPAIISLFLAQNGNWRGGYRLIGVIQLCLTAVLFCTLPLWKKRTESVGDGAPASGLTARAALRLPLAKPAVLAFFCYCGIETTTNLWAASFLTTTRGLTAEAAARGTSLFFLGVTLGRLLTGFATARMSNCNLIRVGQGLCLAGVLLTALPLPTALSLAGLGLVGLGCAPIYPCMLHETPRRFGKEVAQSMMGLQMACAYVGSSLVPTLAGALSGPLTLYVMPAVQLVLLVLMIWASERINRVIPSAAGK